MGWPLSIFVLAAMTYVQTSEFSDVLSDFQYKLDITGLNFIDDLNTVQDNKENLESFATREHYEVTDDSHGHRSRRSAVVMETVKDARKTGNREELDLRSSVPWKTIDSVFEPTDIIDFTITTSSENIRMFAIANHRTNNVTIYRFNETTKNFFFHQSLAEVSPYELESFKARGIIPGNDKLFLAVAGYVDDTGTYETKVTIYELGAAPTYYLIKMQELPYRSVRSLKSFDAVQTTFLILGNYYQDFPTGRQYSSPGQIILMRYDMYSNYFFFYSSLPGSGVVDIEVVNTGREIYLVAANHRANDGRLDIFTYVFLFNELLRNFEMHQTLSTHGARDVEPFVLANEHYVVIANEATGMVDNSSLSLFSDVYKLSHGKFELVQNLETYGAVKWKSLHVPNCKQDVLLIYSDQRNNIDQVGVYSFSHDKETFSAVSFSIYHLDSLKSMYRPSALTLDTFSVQDYSTGDYDLFTIIGANDSTTSITIYKLSYQIVFADSPMDAFKRDVMSQISELNDTLNAVRSLLDQAKNTLADAVVKNQEEVITGTKNFEEFHVSSVKLESLEISHGSIYYLKDNVTYRVNPNVTSYVPVTELETNSSRHESVINDVLDNKENLMYTNVDQVINTSAIFKAIRAKNVNINGDMFVTSGIVSNVNLSHLLVDVVLNNQSIHIQAPKSFSRLTTFSKDVSVNGLVNGLKLNKDVVLNGTNQTIESAKLFTKSSTVKENLLAGLINGFGVKTDGVSINEATVLHGSKTFVTETFTKQVTVTGLVDGVNISTLFDDRVTKSDVQNITGLKHFSRVVSYGDVTINYLVNGINLTRLMEQLDQLSNSSIIFGNKIFEGNVTILGDLVVDNRINGLQFPADVMLKSLNQTVTASKTYSGQVRFDENVNVDGTVDGLKMVELVTLSSVQNIYGGKTFTNSITSNGAFTFIQNATVNDVDLSEFAEKLLTVTGNQTVRGLKFANHVIFYKPNMTGKLNGEEIQQLRSLYQQSLHYHGNQTITGNKTLVQNTSVLQDVNAESVNGFRFPEDFARLHHNQSFTTTKIFIDETKMNTLDANGTINDIYPETFFNSILYKYGNATISGTKVFTKTVTAHKNVNVLGTVNGIDLSEDLMVLSIEQNVTATKYFSTVKFPNQHVTMLEDLGVQTTIDGVDLSELDLSAMTTTRNETITGNICFEQTDYNRSVDYINGIDLSALRDDIVTLNTVQTILSEKYFETFIVDGNLNTTSTVDGIDVSELAASAVFDNGNASINGNVTISKDLLVHESLETNLLNGINLTALSQQVVSKTENASLQHLEISGNAYVTNLTVDSINGLDTNEDIVYTSSHNQTISGHKSFVQLSAKNLTVRSHVNGVNLTLLQEQVVFKNEDSEVDGLKTFHRDVIVNTNVSLSGMVNGFNLTDMELVRTEGVHSQVVSGKKIFADKVVFDDLKTEKVNGVRFNDIIEQAIMTNRDEIVYGNVTFKDGIEVVQDITVTGKLKVTGRLNEMNLTEFDRKTLKTVGTQTMTSKTIVGNMTAVNLTVHGKVNGIDVSTDLMTKHTSQVIKGVKHFRNVYIVGDIIVHGLTNGHNLTDLRDNTLLTNGSLTQVIQGRKTFENVYFHKADANGLVDGLNLTHGGFVTLHTNQTITGTFTFAEHFVTEKLTLIGLLSGVNLRELNRTVVLLSTSQTLNTSINFLHNKYVLGNIIVTGFVNGIDLSSFDRKSPDLTDELDDLESALSLTLSNQCNSITHVKTSLLESSYRLDFYVQYQSIDVQDIRHVEPFEISDVMYLALSVAASQEISNCTQSVILRQEGAKFVPHQYINTADTQKMKFLHAGGNESYLAVFNRGQGCDGIEGLQLLKWNSTTTMFQVYTSLSRNQKNDIELFTFEERTILYLADQLSFTIALLNSSGINVISSQSTIATMLHQFSVGHLKYIAVASRDSDTTSRGYVSISEVNGETSTIRQRIPVQGVSSISSFSSDGHTFLLVSCEKDFTEDGHSTYDVPVEMYRRASTGGTYEWFQSIPTYRAVSTSIFTVGKSIYLMVVSYEHAVTTYKFGYQLGFEEVDQIKQDDVHTAVAYNQYLTVASTATSYDVQQGSRILKLSPTGVDPAQVGLVGQC